MIDRPINFMKLEPFEHVHMTLEQKRVALVRFMNQELASHVRYLADMRGQAISLNTAQKTWDENNPDDGIGLGTCNPFTDEMKNRGARDCSKAQDTVNKWREFRDWVVETFLTEEKDSK